MRKLISRVLNFDFPLGLIFVVPILLFNEWTVRHFLSADGTVELPNRVFVWGVDAIAAAIALPLFFFRIKAPVKILLFNFVFLILLLAAVEGGLYYLVRKTDPVVAAPFLQGIKREIYNDAKEFIQYKPECAQPDDVLGYALKPGTFTFAGAEFSNEFHVNHLGVRDDAKSLEAPEIIVVGDSYAMGWGVDHSESFAEILEAQEKRSVLNTGVSSYGTAREMRILQLVNTQNLRTLVIQYCSNDAEENLAFRKNNNDLQTMSAKRYKQLIRRHDEYRAYYFGKYLGKLLTWRGKGAYRVAIGAISKATGHTVKGPPSDRDEALEFLNVLAHSKTNLESVKIIVLELGSCEKQDSGFVTALSELAAARPEYAGLDLHVVDVSTRLKLEHFFPLDTHINAAGHRIVAEALREAMGPATGAPDSK